MKASVINEIEIRFAQLSHENQLSVLERLVHRMRQNKGSSQEDWENGLSAMAADPEMQRELSSIKLEFSSTEADGLGGN